MKVTLSDKLISIIIPYYNRSFTIKETIESVKKQTYTNWEIIIVDDGSLPDEFKAILNFEEDTRIKVLKRKSNFKGPSSCRNEGASAATGEYLIFLDSDDLLKEFCLWNRMEFMLAHPSLDYAVFNIQKFFITPGDTKELFSLHAGSKKEYLKMFLQLNIPWQVMAPIWKKNVFLALNGFNEKMSYAEDPEFHARALMINSLDFEMVKNSIPDTFYRIGSSSHQNSSADIQKSIIGRIEFIKSLYEVIMWNTELKQNQKKELIKYFQAAYKNIVSHFFTDAPNKFPEEFKSITRFCRQKRIINLYQCYFSKVVFELWQKNIPINKYVHFKGMLTKLYLTVT